jgi:putative SOS response-associated peptidase YedK
MCGRYASFLPAEAIARIFGTVNPLPNLAPSWNVAPTSDVAVVRRDPETGARRLDLLKWGLLPYWTKEPTRAQRPINARSETKASPPFPEEGNTGLHQPRSKALHETISSPPGVGSCHADRPF